jgi:hypothetical protein
MISRYEDLYPLLKPDLPGITDPMLLQSLQATGREFCRFTELWYEDIDYNIVDSEEAYDDAYAAAIALGYSAAASKIAGDAAEDSALQYSLEPHYDAEIIRPKYVWIDGTTNDVPVDPELYEFDVGSQKLTFYSCPRFYSPTAEAWVTATAYALGDYVTSSSLRYLCSIAHTSGTFATDLAAYKWKLMPNDLIVRAILIPRMFCCELAGWFMEKWGEAIVAGTKVHLMAMKNKSWSSPERVPYFQTEYSNYINMALRERNVNGMSIGMSFSTPQWIP